jgi:hypothetical protein
MQDKYFWYVKCIKVIYAECSIIFWPNLNSVFYRSYGAKNVLLNHSLFDNRIKLCAGKVSYHC